VTVSRIFKPDASNRSLHIDLGHFPPLPHRDIAGRFSPINGRWRAFLGRLFRAKCMARPCVARRISKSDERESCINVSGLLVEQICSGPSWVSARIQAD
jgi:hypothetical protein